MTNNKSTEAGVLIEVFIGINGRNLSVERLSPEPSSKDF